VKLIVYVVDPSLQYDLTRRNVFPDELQIFTKYHQMLVRIPLLLMLMTIIYGTLSLLFDRFDPAMVLLENPLQLAAQLIPEDRMEEVLYLTQFSQQYLPVDMEYSDTVLINQANESLESPWYMLEHFATGALTGEASDTPGLLGTLTLDLLVIGDIRDLLVQGYKEYDSGQGDEVIMGLSAVGLLLTLAPELSWAPSMFKTFWRGKRFSEPFQKQILDAFTQARKTGNTKELRTIMINFSDVVDGLGTGPAMSVMKRVDTADDLSLLARTTKIAPSETYSLASINGIKSLHNISITGAKQGKLIKRVKLASRQQKVLGKSLAIIPTGWLICFFGFSLFLIYYIIYKKRKLFDKACLNLFSFYR